AYNSSVLADWQSRLDDFGAPIEHRVRSGAAFAGVAYNPRSRTVATGTSQRRVCLWTLPKGEWRVPYAGHRGGVLCVAYSPAGRCLASGGHDRTVRLWDVGLGGVPGAVLDHTGAVRAVTFSPDGKTLAAVAGRGVRLWDLPDSAVRTNLRGHTGDVQ